MLAMFGPTPGVYEYIVDIHEYESMEKLPEYLMHEVLEYGGGVDKSIRHDTIFVVARRSHEGGLPLVPLTYPDEVVCAAEVQLGEETCSAKLLQCSRDEGKWIPELDCNLIQTPIIYARPQTTVLLYHKEEAQSSRGCRWSDVALLESFLYVLLHGLLFSHGALAHLEADRWHSPMADMEAA